MHEIKNIKDFLSKIDLNFNIPNAFFYRGESKEYDESCVPKLFRGEEDYDKYRPRPRGCGGYKNEKLRAAEWLLQVKRLEGRQPEDSIGDFELITLAQHYGLKTRLLDWSTNPLVALYFACLSNKDEDGFIFMIKIEENDIHLEGRDEGNRSTDEDRENAYNNPFNFTNCGKFFCFEKKHYFLNKYSGNKRVINQKSVFSIHPNKEISFDFEEEFKVPSKYKERFKKQLNGLNINGHSLCIATRDLLAENLNQINEQEDFLNFKKEIY